MYLFRFCLSGGSANPSFDDAQRTGVWQWSHQEAKAKEKEMYIGEIKSFNVMNGPMADRTCVVPGFSLAQNI